MALLDDFNRADGVLGGSWVGATTDYTIVGNAMNCLAVGGYIFWPTTFSGSHEISFLISSTPPGFSALNLLLKATGSTLNNGLVLVQWINNTTVIHIYVYDPVASAYELQADFAATVLAIGDTFYASASAAGVIEVKKNGTSLGTVTIATGPSGFDVTRGGQVGIGSGMTGLLLDDATGGDMASADPYPERYTYRQLANKWRG